MVMWVYSKLPSLTLLKNNQDLYNALLKNYNLNGKSTIFNYAIAAAITAYGLFISMDINLLLGIIVITVIHGFCILTKSIGTLPFR
jgi:hypothetical protein